MNGMQQNLLRALVALTALSAMLAACGGDDSSKFELAISSDRESLAGDGADAATITVSVLDNSFNPPSAGSTVTLTANGASGPTGAVNGTDGGVGQSVTDAQGFATFDFTCTSEGTVTLIAIFQDGSATANTATTIECTAAPDGDWVISTVADRRFIGTGETTTLAIQGSTASGDGVPQGTRFQCSTESDLVSFSRGSSSTVLEANTLGRASAVVVSQSGNGTAQVCCAFEDTRFGDQAGCVSLVIGDAPETDTCIGTVSNVRAPADGRTTTSVTLNVSRADGSSVESADIVMLARSGTWVDGAGAPIAGADTPIGGLTGTGGDFTARLQSPTVGGSADIEATASFNDSDGNPVTLACEFPEPLSFYGPPSCIFQGMTPDVIGIENSSLEENGTLTFCFEQGAGQPPAASRVDFDFAVTIPGVELSATSGTTDATTGCVSVEINSGRTAGLVEVRATLDFSEESDSVCTSGPLPIRHARPTAEGWNFTCEQINMPGLLFAAGDEVFTDYPMQCSSILRDRFNNPVNNSDVQVFFAAEQGTIDSPVSPDDNGRVVTIYNPNGGLPRDVEPNDATGEWRIVNTLDGTEVNNRDGFVTLIAWTNGEEEFYDENGDGNYNEGEVFVDLTEPYLDNDDNDVYNPTFPVNDRFFDVETEDNDINETFDEANGEWDANTAIWTRTGIVTYGPPLLGRIDDYGYSADFSAPSLSPQFFSYWEVDGVPGGLGAVFFVDDQDGAVVNFYIRDEQLNAPNIDHITCEFELTGCDPSIDTIGAVAGSDGRNFEFTRDLRNLNSSGGNATGENVFRRVWSTNFDYPSLDAPAILCQGYIEPGQLDEETPEATCTLNTTVTYAASAAGGGSANAAFNFVAGLRIN